MKTHRIAVLRGDGIGPEVIDAAVTVLRTVEKKIGAFKLNLSYGEAGLNSIGKFGTNVPDVTVDILKQSDACLKGPMTTPEQPEAPKSAALTIRRLFGLYANVRPCFSMPNVNTVKTDVDLVIVRENTEGLYSGIEFNIGEDTAVALRVVTRQASERIARFAFDLAAKRRRHVSYVHKANILRRTDGVFSKAVLGVSRDFPSVAFDSYHVDAMAMELVKNPEHLDVVVTTNMFGDILSDEAAQLVGGLGLAAGGNIGEKYAMFEPVHGSAPKYTGQNKVNPIATIFAGKMLLEHLQEKEAANAIQAATVSVLREGKTLTYDLGGKAKTSEVTSSICQKIEETEK